MKGSSTLLTADQGSEPVTASKRVHSFQQPNHWAVLTSNPLQRVLWQDGERLLARLTDILPAPILADNYLTFINQRLCLNPIRARIHFLKGSILKILLKAIVCCYLLIRHTTVMKNCHKAFYRICILLAWYKAVILMPKSLVFI